MSKYRYDGQFPIGFDLDFIVIVLFFFYFLGNTFLILEYYM